MALSKFTTTPLFSMGVRAKPVEMQICRDNLIRVFDRALNVSIIPSSMEDEVRPDNFVNKRRPFFQSLLRVQHVL